MTSHVLPLNNLNEKQSFLKLNVKKINFLLISIITFLSFTIFFKSNEYEYIYESTQELTPKCPKSVKIPTKEHDTIQYIMNDPEFRIKSANVFSKGVQVDTVVYDTMTMEDYKKFSKFHEYLETNFPLVYKTAKIHKINTYGLLFEFPGTNPDLKPILLNAHQDTVPIGDPNDWTKDPFGGNYDGENIWGRGSSDCKNLLIGLMEAMEMIINNNKFIFERTVMFGFGFDEEKSGFDGAKHIGEYLEEYLGPNSIYLLMDEGIPMCLDVMGDYYGMIMTGEKGYTDLTVNIQTPGGHSSNPKDHTSIGMMSFFLTMYEKEQYSPKIPDINPLLRTFECAAEQGHLSESIRSIALNSRGDDNNKAKLISFIDSETDMKYNIQTSQAIDIVNGGDKANSLPRNVNATINHRIAYGDTPETIFAKATKYGKITAKKYGIGLTVRGEEIYPETEIGNMNIDYFGVLLYPAKVTPDFGEVWDLVTGHIRGFYEDEIYPEQFIDDDRSKKFIITPSLMTANTDTRHYWNLTDNIFKSTPGTSNSLLNGVHGPDEHTSMFDHLQVVAFFYNFLTSATQENK